MTAEPSQTKNGALFLYVIEKKTHHLAVSFLDKLE